MFGIHDRVITINISRLITKIGLVMIDAHERLDDPPLTKPECFSAGIRYLMDNSRLFPSPKGKATKGRLNIFEEELYVAIRIEEMPKTDEMEMVTYLHLMKDLVGHVLVPEVAADKSTADGFRIFQQALRRGEN